MGNRTIASLVETGLATGSAGTVRYLPDELRGAIESRSGTPLDNVRVHHNSSKPAQLGARAFTQGDEIHLGPGQEGHLAHEAWHVVQQRQQRVKPTGSRGGLTINDDAALEAEADRMGISMPSLAGAQPVAHSPHDSTRTSAANSLPIQAKWIIRDGRKVEVPDDYQLQSDERDTVRSGEGLGDLDRLPKDFVANVLGYLADADDGQSLLKLSRVSTEGRRVAQDTARTSAPYASPAIFAAATSGHFKSFGRRQSAAVTPTEASALGWQHYQRGQADTTPVYVERLGDKNVLFPKMSPARKQAVRTGQLFDPEGARPTTEQQARIQPPPPQRNNQWSPEINDAWTLGAIHARRPIRLLSDPTEANTWEASEDRPTAMGRELVQAHQAGYTVVAGPADYGVGDLVNRGQLLNPPQGERRPASIEDAALAEDKKRAIKDLLNP